jgi:hypothetical protein
MPEGLNMALLRRKRLVRFSAQEPTFVEQTEGGSLTEAVWKRDFERRVLAAIWA